jgi:hypothetical protein
MNLDQDKIARITKAAATTTLGSESFVDVTNTSITDSTGDSALQITIVLTPESTDEITGERALRTLSEVRRRLQEAGEERLPIVHYATQEELAESGDSQL